MVESIFPSPSKQIDKKAAPESQVTKRPFLIFSNADAKYCARYQKMQAISGKTLFS